ncbi:hypothetical protein V6R21_03320 [Limibacter armeniacum]|uniref:hypothetical protein n=1 Tax=Limibacter armeniacum TaxID=466084 RepID=UPI002FE53C9B
MKSIVTIIALLWLMSSQNSMGQSTSSDKVSRSKSKTLLKEDVPLKEARKPVTSDKVSRSRSRHLNYNLMVRNKPVTVKSDKTKRNRKRLSKMR